MNDSPPQPSVPVPGFGKRFKEFLKKHLPESVWQQVLFGAFGVIAMGVLAMALVALALTPTLPDLDDLSEKSLKVPMRVYTAEGELLAEFGEEKRIPVRIDDVPERLVQAILAAEDHAFFYHHGVDYIGIARAALSNLRRGGHSQGASTITMQVARNFLLSPEKTYTRKLKEVLLAFKIERELSKPEILELYVNKIFLGHRAYGFAAAAQIYYGKTLDELTTSETAMLAGLPKAPSRDNPLTNPQSATERRNYVLRHMLALGYIDQAAHDQAVSAPLTASKHAVRFAVEAPHVAEMVRQHMIERYAEKTYGSGFHVYTTISAAQQRAANDALRKGLIEYDRRHGWRGAAGHITLRGEPDRGRLDDALKDYREVGGLMPGVVVKVEDKSATVYTQEGDTAEIHWGGLVWARRYIDENTLGSSPTRAADVLRPGHIVYLERLTTEAAQEEAGGEWRLAQIPDVAGAVVALRPGDGAILALAGGFDFYHSSFNRAVQAERQPGSSLKPFIYAAALEKGFTPATTVSGAPIVIEDATLEDVWRPEDYSKQFFGPTRLRKALTLSLNLVSVRLLRAIGPGYAVEYLERFGFDANMLPRNLSLALGTASATPLTMARAFTVFANGGHRIDPYFITRVEDGEHKILEQASPPVVCPHCPDKKTAEGADGAPYAPAVLTPEINFLMNSMLRDVVREGTGRAALTLGRKDLAGKTGTTNEYRDAWFSGFNHEVAATAWIGFDQPAPLGRGEAGGRAALPIWINFMRVALDGVPEKPLAVPEGIVTRRVNLETGKPAANDDPESIEEFFLKDAEDAPAIAADGPEKTPAPAKDSAPENVRQQLF
jgi:penicillin-binding protein 1A